MRLILWSATSTNLIRSNPLYFRFQSQIISSSFSGLSAVQIASDWLMAHAHDQTLDDQCPRHFHLHLCPGPSTPLAKNLQASAFLIWNSFLYCFFFCLKQISYQKKQKAIWKEKIYLKMTAFLELHCVI